MTSPKPELNLDELTFVAAAAEQARLRLYRKGNVEAITEIGHTMCSDLQT